MLRDDPEKALRKREKRLLLRLLLMANRMLSGAKKWLITVPMRGVIALFSVAKMQQTQPIVLKNLPNRDAKVVDRLGALCRDAVRGLF